MTDDTDDVVKGGQGTPTKKCVLPLFVRDHSLTVEPTFSSSHPPSSSTKENILPPPSSTSNSPARRRIDREDTIPPSTAVSRPPVPTTGFTFGKRSYSEFFEEISQNRDPVPDTAKTPLLHAPASLPTVDNTPIDPTPHPSSSTLLSPALEGHSPSANNVSRRHRTLRRKRAARSNAPASVSEDDPLTLRILFALEAVKPRFRVGSDLFDVDPDYATEIPCQWDLSTGGHSRHDIYTEKSGAYKHLKEQHSVGSAINGAVPVRVTCQWGDHCGRSIKLESLARHIESHVSGSVYCQLCREWRNERGQPARCIGHLRKQCSFTREGATTLEELHAKLVELDIITAEENLPVVPSSPVLPAQASSSTSQPGPSSIAGPSSIPSASTATSHFVAQTSGGGNKRRRVK